MTSAARHRAGHEGGFVTVQYVWGVALSLVFLVVVANLVAFQYGRGVVRGALDEGVRAGSRATAAAAECQDRALQVLDQLLGGTLGGDVSVACTDLGDRIVASAEGRFPAWIAVVPDHHFHVQTEALKEQAP